mmetsp:Transcript_14904/g.16131  ORF Transcript_14904/g.16131 Transcript_14904/m.16131 type:complete len:220 (+) Transcript_14904:164-823(+)
MNYKATNTMEVEISSRKRWEKEYHNWNRVTLPTLSENIYIGGYPTSFWKFIINQKITIGIQLAQFYESYHLQVDSPLLNLDDKSIIILQSEERMNEDLVHRVYKIEHDNEQWILHHFDFQWPDLGVPERSSFELLLNQYYQVVDDHSNMFVHCFGGHGRSGTFVLTLALIANQDKSHSTPRQLLQLLRNQRFGAVETTKQERFADIFSQYYKSQHGLSI